MKRNVYPSYQAGVGLIEIMIAMVIGLFVLGGLTQIFLSNKQNFRIQEAQSRVQENARLVSVLLSSSIGNAGFRQNPQDDPAGIFGAASAIGGTDGGSGGASDTITIRFQRDGIITDCLGSAGSSATGSTTAAGTIATNAYQVDASNVLRCDAGTSATPSFQPLIDNVENMQILFGEDTNGDGSVDRYVNAGAVGLNWNNVLSVYLAVLLISDRDVKPTAEAKNYYLLGNKISISATNMTARKQRRVIEQVISLRNRLL